MKHWFGQAATLALIAAGLTGCGGGGGTGPVAGSFAAPPPAVVEAPAQVMRVESWQRPAAPLALQREVIVEPTARPAPALVRLSRLAAASAAPGVAQTGRPLQVGTGREVALSADPQRMRGLLQFKAGNAGPVAAVSFTSPGAAGVRLGLRVLDLPAGAHVRGYRQGGATAFDIAGSEILAAIARNRDAGDISDKGRTFWTPVVDSEEVTLEIALPAGASPDAVQVSVPTLSHVGVKSTELDTLMIGQAASCEIDVTCSADAASQSRATARMVFTDGGFTYACSGTLLNDAQSSGTPYFLTADHCISTQTAASSLITYWFYKSPSCNAQVLDPSATQLFGGATLLYSSTSTDTSFLRLNQQPPASAVYAGWSASPPQFNQELVGIHHPRGDLQKISRGSLQSYINCSVGVTDFFSCREAPESGSNFLSTVWSLGTVESGSSGSALFATVDGNRYVVGQLKGGSASCQDPRGSNAYGRFDVAYNAALNRWLSPTRMLASNLDSATPVPRVPVFRFYNASTNAHFYTRNAAERDYVIASNPSFRYEGPAFYIYATEVNGSYPVYRMYNQRTGRHFYTMAKGERDWVLTNPDYLDEGISWYAQSGAGGAATPVTRFYNASAATHFYALGDEVNAVRNNSGYALEGVAYYAWYTQ